MNLKPDGSVDYEGPYRRLGHLLATVPVVTTHAQLMSPDVQQWFARAHAAVDEVGISTDPMTFRMATQQFPYASWKVAVNEIIVLVHRAFAHCEARVPAAAAGAFVPVAKPFDAFAAIGKIFGSATGDLLIVDPYMDEKVLTDFAVTAPAGVRIRLLSDSHSAYKSLAPAVARWQAQHGASSPLEARLSAPKALHDRAIFVDGREAWTLTQSLKDFAARSPAEIIRADDTADLKIQAYEAIWAASQVI